MAFTAKRIKGLSTKQQKGSVMNILFIDIETANATSKAAIDILSQSVRPPGQIKKQESIDKWWEEKSHEAIAESVKKTGLNGLYGEVICIGFGVDNEEINTVHRNPGQSEAELLRAFFNVLIESYGVNFNPLWVGHNIARFDLPFLLKRCIINCVEPTFPMPRNPKPWSRDIFDTLYQMTGDISSGGSLNNISRLLGIGTKTDGIDGSVVNDFWLDGRIGEIAEYCKQDVHLTREIYKRINFIDRINETLNPLEAR